MSEIPQLPIEGTGALDRWPDWYRPSKARKGANERVMRGLHPTGKRLTVLSEATCGNCKNRYRKHSSPRKSFFKCFLIKETSGPGTDVIMKWRGCEDWFPDDTPQRCAECHSRLILETNGLDLPKLSCDGCGGMFDLAAWKWIKRAPRCRFQRVDGRWCMLTDGHSGPHGVGQ